MKKPVKTTIWVLILAIAVYGGYRAVTFFLTPHRAIQQVYLIPKDAIFIIQSSSPIDDWETFSGSEPWQCLKRTPSFADIDRNASVLDSIIRENKKLFSMVGKRDLMISAHKVRNGFWDFLFVIDLQKISEIEALKEQIVHIYTYMDYKVTYRKYQHVDIMELRDQQTREILYTAFVENHFIASFSSKLIEASINEQNNPETGLNPHFIEVDRLVGDKGLYRIYIQYDYLPQFLEMYVGDEIEYMTPMIRSMSWAGLRFNVSNEKFELDGYSLFSETVDPYVSALLHSGKKEAAAPKMLSARTAFYTHVGFDNPTTFLKEIEKALASGNPDYYNSYKKAYKQVESLSGISLADDFLSWMSGEFAIAQMEQGGLGNDPELILAIQANDIHFAKEKMSAIERSIKKRTPINVKSVNYKSHSINYVELKGFFALFFGKLFNRFERPYYTYIDDYVVFSNKPSTILSFIEDYEQGFLLKDDPSFKHLFSQLDKKSTYFFYTNTQKFFPLIKPIVTPATWKDLNSNKEIAFSFPTAGLQITEDRQQIVMKLALNYLPYKEETMASDPDDDEEEAVTTENEQLQELERFYVEKFQGNIYRDYYPDGILKIKCEIRNGKRHGKYHEYYETGKLKVRGQYAKGNPKGTWKYYTHEGKLERKVKH